MSRRISTLHKSVIYLALILCVGLGSCGSPANSNGSFGNRSSLTAIPTETPIPFRFGNPVENETQALVAAESGVRSGFSYSEPLIVAFAQEMSFAESEELTHSSSSAGQAIQRVWVVFYFDDKWQSLPPNPRITSAPPFRGCVYVIVNAEDGLLISTGGPLVKGEKAECDK